MTFWKCRIKNSVFIIRNASNIKSVEVTKLLDNAFKKSKLEYAALIWKPFSDGHVKGLENIQRGYLKFFAFTVEIIYISIGGEENQSISYFLLDNKIDCHKLLERLSFPIPIYRFSIFITPSSLWKQCAFNINNQFKDLDFHATGYPAKNSQKKAITMNVEHLSANGKSITNLINQVIIHKPVLFAVI